MGVIAFKKAVSSGPESYRVASKESNFYSWEGRALNPLTSGMQDPGTDHAWIVFRVANDTTITMPPMLFKKADLVPVK